jgi:hypothetical protein
MIILAAIVFSVLLIVVGGVVCLVLPVGKAPSIH